MSDYSLDNIIFRILREEIQRLVENSDSEGLAFGGKGRNSDGIFRFYPGKYDTNTSTRIFDDDHKEQVRMVKLPKSGVMSYNLYKIESMSISKALKHPET